MGYRDLNDERMRAMTLFVSGEEPMTDEEIANLLGIARSTIIRWKKEDNWISKRKENNVTPLDLAMRIKKELNACIDEIQKVRDEKGFVGPEYIKRLDYYSRILVRIDGQFDRKGNALQVLADLINFCTDRKEREGLKFLNRIVPEYLRKVESLG
ncbi:MAG: YfeC-like transcriptional regulator [Ignavibacteriota bacterium]